MWTGFFHFLAFFYFTRFYPILRLFFMRKSCTCVQVYKMRTKLNTKHLGLTSYANPTPVFELFL
jgi:hypothetical protein